MGTMLTGICTLFCLIMLFAGVVWVFEAAPFLGFLGIVIVGATAIAVVGSFGKRT